MFDEQEKQALVQFAKESLKEKRRARRWGIFFKLALLFIVAAVLQTVRLENIELPGKTAEHTALVKLEGIILPNTPASSDQINLALMNAFENEQARAVILELNTPGGSAVQSARIYNEIKRLRDKYPDKPIYAVVNDICTSGGMFVAVATDRIYADPASLLGSIGVIMNGFGLEEMIDKLGIKRRLLTAGEHKAMLDPFLSQNSKEVAHVQKILDEVHAYFIGKVKEGRGDKLAEDADLFSGLIWNGAQAKELGLVDEFGDVKYVAREVAKIERIEEYRGKEDLFERLAFFVSKALSLALTQSLFHPLMY